ncbi:MAG: hypothetical protein QOG87_1937 [Actinomycetota bacterium]|jgi:hypothetical protein
MSDHEMPTTDPEAPEADALEQAKTVDEPVGLVSPPTSDPEAPEADALEQAEAVPLDPEEA